jgi:rhodanese-related sulfurtransferase
MKLKKSVKTLLEEAAARTQGISALAAQARVGDAQTVFVDIRDVRELERDGMIPGAFHAPRGMLEFWVDPESKYYKPVFVPDKAYIL